MHFKIKRQLLLLLLLLLLIAAVDAAAADDETKLSHILSQMFINLIKTKKCAPD